MRRYHAVLTNPKASEKLTIIMAEMQHLPDLENTDSQKEYPCLKSTIYNDRRQERLSFKTDTVKLVLSCTVIASVYNSRIFNLIKKWQIWQINRRSWQNKFVIWSALTCFSSGFLYWMEQLFINKTNFVKNGCFLSNKFFLIVLGIEVIH